jgi:hypothetical protein
MTDLSPSVALPPDLVTLAEAIGEAWATELVGVLRAEDRDLTGAWPGTISEARSRVIATLDRRPNPEILEGLARLANVAARRGWRLVSQPDPEL